MDKKNKIVPPTSNGKLVNIGRVTPDFSLFEERRFYIMEVEYLKHSL